MHKELELKSGSYNKNEVKFLLKDISQYINEKNNEEREKLIQGGMHYSEMLPIEYKPSDAYLQLFYYSLEKTKEKLAVAVGVVSERIIQKNGTDIVLVSLARAGTPAGILMKRYIDERYNINLPHYSISIIRGKGIDENAIKYILEKHPNKKIQFLDGWTGKGAITKELTKACEEFNEKYQTQLDSSLAVIADPGYCTDIFGTREDFLIPSACLNSTVSGLVSRTVHRKDLIGENDFHGGKVYWELKDEDVSNEFVDVISSNFKKVYKDIDNSLSDILSNSIKPTWQGLTDVNKIQEQFNINNINFIKPGIGETTRVLLRRVPWKILIREESKNLAHILQLAKERNVTIEKYPLKAYECCGLIEDLRR